MTQSTAPQTAAPKELILVRHGQSEGNVAAEAAARNSLERIEVPARDADVVLSATGREQAAAGKGQGPSIERC